MVSGFLTSPCDHWRMSSAVARPIRNSSKKLTSSTGCLLSPGNRQTGPRPGRTPCCGRRPGEALDLFDAARLAPRQVDTELFRRAEDLVVGVAHLEGHAVAGEHLNVEAQRLH